MKRLQKKSDYFEVFEIINRPLGKYTKESGAAISYGQTGVGYGKKISEFEGFSRMLWGIGPAISDIDDEWLAQIIKGLISGTDPKHEDYWGTLHHRDQRMVEMPAVALTLLYSDKLVWYRLSSKEQRNLFVWLNQIFDYSCADGNWQFFQVIVGLVLKKLGYEINEEKIEEALSKIDNCARENGWYQDSSRGRLDYYTPFAFHYYGLLYSVLAPEEKESALFKERAVDFAKEYVYFFAEDGSNIPFGRSMTYRYAMSAFWSALIYAGVYPFEIGVMKGIINRSLAWWLKKDIFDTNGILTLGYTYPQLTMTEGYNSSLSPYWSNKIFLLLALPEDHEYWQAEELPLPKRMSLHLLKPMNALVACDRGHVQLLNAGQPGPNYHTLTNEKYFKFAYSSHFGFSIPRSNQSKEEAVMDSMVGIQRLDTTVLTNKNGQNVEEVGPFYVRDRVADVSLKSDVIGSTWQIMGDSRIRTWLTFFSGWQIRIHRIWLDAPMMVYETGYALENAPDNSGAISEEKLGHYFIGDKGFTGIIDLLATDENRKATPVNGLPNTNLMTCENTFLPGLQACLPKGMHWLATGVFAHPDSDYGQQNWSKAPKLTLSMTKASLSIDTLEKEIVLIY